MTKEAYGIPVPRGVPKDWKPTAKTLGIGGPVLREYSVPLDWEDPVKCVAWFDRFGRLRIIVGHYANGRSATVRIDAEGVSRTIFGEVKEEG